MLILIGMMLSTLILIWLAILTIVLWKELMQLAKDLVNEAIAFFS